MSTAAAPMPEPAADVERTFESGGRLFEAGPCENPYCRREHAWLPCGPTRFDYHPVEGKA